MNVIKKIEEQIKNNPILVYMKGSPDFPSCGFSAKVIEILSSLDIQFSYINVLENEDIRFALPKYSHWPTFPQLWVNGELIGGCDIIVDMFNNGELKKVLNISS